MRIGPSLLSLLSALHNIIGRKRSMDFIIYCSLSHCLCIVDPPQLEKYSTNLEGVVAERTAELAAEKAKTDELVCRKFQTLRRLTSLKD